MDKQQTERRYEPNHSFSKKPSRDQILIICVLFLQMIVFYSLFIQLLHHAPTLRTCLISAFSVSFTLSISMGLWAGLIDPTDTLVKGDKKDSEQKVMDYRLRNGKKSLHYCKSCETFVKVKSYHCKTCNRCAQDFDHHCTYLNVCIGQKNYKQFVLASCATLVNHTVFLVTLVAISIAFSKHNDQSAQIYDSAFFIWGVVIGWIVGLLVLVVVAFLVVLMIFHFYLWYRELTTLAFLLEKKRQQSLAKVNPEGQNLNQTQVNLKPGVKEPRNLKIEPHLDIGNKSQSFGDELDLNKGNFKGHLNDNSNTFSTDFLFHESKTHKKDGQIVSKRFTYEERQCQRPRSSSQNNTPNYSSECIDDIKESGFSATNNQIRNLSPVGRRQKTHSEYPQKLNARNDYRKNRKNKGVHRRYSSVGQNRGKSSIDLKASITKLVLNKSALGTLLNEDTGTLPTISIEKLNQLDQKIDLRINQVGLSPLNRSEVSNDQKKNKTAVNTSSKGNGSIDN